MKKTIKIAQSILEDAVDIQKIIDEANLSAPEESDDHEDLSYPEKGEKIKDRVNEYLRFLGTPPPK